MKDIFNQLHVGEILNRIDQLGPNSKPQWGKMDVAQMLAHCSFFQDIAMGNAFPYPYIPLSVNPSMILLHVPSLFSTLYKYIDFYLLTDHFLEKILLSN